MSRSLTLAAVLLPLLPLLPPLRPARAQPPRSAGGAIVGIVRGGDGAPARGATISLRRSADTVQVGVALADSTGAFHIARVAPGSYRVDIRRIGFRTASRTGVTITGAADRVDLGVIRLEPIAVTLASVAVRAAPSQVTALPDRNVYATSRMPVAAGGTATDVLRNIPELQVSPEGTVTSRGATPRIYINGRPAPMQGESLDRYLQQLPAERIDRVEVISNPSARYEADGQGGVVNIVLKRGTGAGLSGSVAASAATRNQQNGSGNLNFQGGRLSLFGNASVGLSRSRSANSDLRQNLNVHPTTFIQQDSRNLSSADMADVGLSGELRVGSRGTVWADVGAGRSPSDASVLAAYTYLDDLQNPTQRYDRVNDTRLRGRFGHSSVGYRHDAGTRGTEWSVELRQSTDVMDHADESTRLALGLDGAALDAAPELTFAGQGQSQRGVSLDASLSRPWGASGRVEAGYRSSARRTGDDFHMWVDSSGSPGVESDATGDFRQREGIQAAFVSVSRQIGRFYLQTGVRGELATMRRALPLGGETFESTDRNLFPSATISTEMGAGGQLSLSYSRRVDRPWGGILNPATPNVDPLNRRIGNPYLMPRYTHSLVLTVTRTGRLGLLQFSPYYRRTVDSWDQIRTVDTTGVSTVTWQNLATITSYGGSVSASLMPTRRVSGFLNVSAYREVRDASNLETDFSGTSTQLAVVGNASVRATSALSLQGAVTYLPARNLPQGRISPMVFSSLGVRRQLRGGRGALLLSIVDPFELQRFTFTTRDRTHVQIGSSTFSARRATLGVSYSFGRPPQRKERGKREDGAQEREVRVIR
jgi:hypothetical protein